MNISHLKLLVLSGAVVALILIGTKIQPSSVSPSIENYIYDTPQMVLSPTPLDIPNIQKEYDPLDGFVYREDIPLSKKIQKHIYKKCNEYQLDPMFVTAIIEKESRYNTNAISENGQDFGLGQINISNYENLSNILGITDLLDPYDNIECMCYLLRYYANQEYFGEQLLMLYNGGHGYADPLFQQGIVSSEYSRDVMSIYMRLTAV